MNFFGFIILLGIALLVSLILHYVVKYFVRKDLSSFFEELIIAWIGGWLGSSVLGYWPNGWAYDKVYFIPAFLGAIALVVLCVEVSKTFCVAKEKECEEKE
ncbi:MAG: hypothetical protein IEMM0006_1206 [bacterium]|nr:MAG: hypothetical protein IEMM0006_1206 [bacterium]